jgi:hypothetical protein
VSADGALVCAYMSHTWLSCAAGVHSGQADSRWSCARKQRVSRRAEQRGRLLAMLDSATFALHLMLIG